MNRYRVHAELETPLDTFEQLHVEEALDGGRETIIQRTSESVVYTVNRLVRAANDEEARQKARNGSLLPSVEHEVTEIRNVTNIDKRL